MPACVGRKRVARLMLTAGLAGVSRRRHTVTTVREGARQAPDLVDRDFTAERPNMLWVADITYIPTWAGFLYLAVVLEDGEVRHRLSQPFERLCNCSSFAYVLLSALPRIALPDTERAQATCGTIRLKLLKRWLTQPPTRFL